MKTRYIVFTCLLFSTVYSAVAIDRLPSPPERYGSIEVLREERGIPHVFSSTDEGAMYGLGYATAEDRFFQMVYSLRTIQGRLAEFLGDVKKTNRDMTTVDHDIKMRTMGFYRAAQRIVKTLDDESIRLLEAYSQGVNDYVHNNPDQLLYLFAKYDLKPETWKPEDCIAVWWNVARFFAPEGLHDLMTLHRREEIARRNPFGPVIDDSAAAVKREDVSDEWVEKVNRFMEEHGLNQDKNSAQTETNPKFSHAWVVGGSKTTTGSAVLCSDPQTPVRNPSLFYEYHINGKTFNARGMGVPGSPIILIGWNEYVAWGMTALGADQADLFLLKTSPDHPDSYWYNGEWHKMGVWNETIHVKGGEDITLKMKETHFGPVADAIVHDVQPGESVAMKRVPVCDRDVETIQGAVAMWRAHNANEFDQALAQWRFPSANVVFGDRDGNCGYQLTAAIPIRSPHAVDGGRVAIEGTQPGYDWQGFFPAEILPHVINPKRGYILSGNHRAIESFYPSALGVSTGASGDTDRSWRLRQRLQGKESFSPEDMLDIHHDTTNAAKKALIDFGYHIMYMQNYYMTPEAVSALDYLQEWYKQGSKSKMEIPGTELVNLIPMQFRIINTPLTQKYGGGFSGLCLFLKTVQAKMKEDPFHELNQQIIDYVDSVLSTAWLTAVNRYGNDPSLWNQKAREGLTRQSMGYFETLDSFPALDREQSVHIPELSCIDGGTIFSQRAQSYAQWVPLHDVDTARSLLPIGESERPDSPYRLANLDNWETGEMYPAPLSRKAVEDIAKPQWQFDPARGSSAVR